MSSFVLDPLDFKQRHGKLLSVLSTDLVEGLLSILVQLYDTLYRCFTFPDYQLVPTLEEYTHLLGIPVSDKVPFSGLEEIPRSHIIVEALHLKKSEVNAHLVKKGGIMGLTFEFLIGKAIVIAQAGSVDAFEAIFVFLIYGLALFPNVDDFVDVSAIRIFLIGDPVPTLLGDTYFSLHLRNSKGGGTIRLISLTNDDIAWYESALGSLDIIDSCGEFSNVPPTGTQGGINYNPALARRQLGKGRSELGPCNCVALEAYTIWVKKKALELKMSYACERPMSLVVAEPSTLHNQDLESKDKDSLIELIEDRAVKRQREPEGPYSSSMPHPSGAWKKIVDQLVLEKSQMKTSFESKIRHIRGKYTPAARSSDTVARGSLG
ncbi:hypothetical protein KIW84_022572 [Lathyrus oleraceus]|uniref:DUF7745 domain-containing protein n=1 Tax=Pisum sativum TaxID=3888 RepID=A0A9D5B6T4_PEA|nr:hypothetical protein KIW84_022572 [Pisum sativum]